MVSALQSVRLFTSQSMLKALKQVEQQNQSQSDSTTAQSALLSRYGIDTSSDTSSSFSNSGSGSGYLSTMLDALNAKYVTEAETPQTAEVPDISSDITTPSFMTGLKAKLKELQAAPDTAAQGDAMLAALKAGTLVVSDPIDGREIKAWDVDDAAQKAVTHRTATMIDNTGWSAFLKTHLTRGEGGSYARKPDGSFTDRPSGANAYFGTLGSGYVYVTWPQAGKTG